MLTLLTIVAAVLLLAYVAVPCAVTGIGVAVAMAITALIVWAQDTS